MALRGLVSINISMGFKVMANWMRVTLRGLVSINISMGSKVMANWMRVTLRGLNGRIHNIWCFKVMANWTRIPLRGLNGRIHNIWCFKVMANWMRITLRGRTPTACRKRGRWHLILTSKPTCSRWTWLPASSKRICPSRCWLLGRHRANRRYANFCKQIQNGCTSYSINT
jgi:hypothetical protein